MTKMVKVTTTYELKKLEDFGRYQLLQYLLICLPLLVVSMSHVNYIFVAEDINYRNLVRKMVAYRRWLINWHNDLGENVHIFQKIGSMQLDRLLQYPTATQVKLLINSITTTSYKGTANRVFTFVITPSRYVCEGLLYLACRVPECENENPTVNPSWLPDNADTKCFRPTININRYNLANQTCTNTTFDSLLEECHEWIYESNNSIVAGLNLGCESWKTTLVGSIHNAGMIVSMMFTGWMADKLGRKPTAIVCSVGGCVGLIKIFVTNYNAYIAIEFLESLMCSGLYTVAVVLLIEVGGETKRVSAGIIFSYAVYLGEIVFAFLAMGLQYWKSLVVTVNAPMVLFLFYVILLRESTRWQMIRGKMLEAKITLKTIARINKINVSAKEIEEIDDSKLRVQFNVQYQKEKENMKVILKSKQMMTRLAVTSFCFFTSSFLYYGLVVHSILLPGNKYTNFILSSLTSFPGELIAYYTLNKYGRRISLQCGYLFSALSLIAQTYSPESIIWLKILLFLFGKLGVVICFTGIYTYSLELFPTSVRGSLFGLGNTVARVGSMLAPLTPLLATELAALPSLLFSLTAVVSAFLLIFIPETKSLPMFDTIAQVEAYKVKITTHL